MKKRNCLRNVHSVLTCWIKGWKEPRCVEACPTGALIFGDVNDPNSEISKVIAQSKDKLEDLHQEYGLEPNVHYIGIPKRFIAGEVVFKDKKDECAVGVKVRLLGKGKDEKSIVTDNYGDFEFEGLEADKEYTVVVRAKWLYHQEDKNKDKDRHLSG